MVCPTVWKISHELYNPRPKARGLSPRTGGQTMVQLLHVPTPKTCIKYHDHYPS